MGQPSPAQVAVYDLHDLIQLRATFLGTDGVTPADPSTVTFIIKDASGVVASYVYTGGAGGGSITRTGVGGYFKDIAALAVGSYFYRYEGTGGVIVADEWSFEVAASFIL